VLYFTYLPRSPRGRICIKFGIGYHLPDIIICAKFYDDRFRGFDSVGVQISSSPSTKLVAVNTDVLPVMVRSCAQMF